MLARLAKLGTTHPRRMALCAFLLLLVAGLFGGPATQVLQSERAFDDAGSQSTAARVAIERATGGSAEPGVLALVDAAPDSPAVASAVAALKRDPAVAAAVAPEPGDRTPLVSKDGSATIIATSLKHEVNRDDAVDRLEQTFAGRDDVQLGGADVAFMQVNQQAAEDLARGELLAFPILLVLALIFFRGVAAAVLPLAIGIVSVLTTFALLRVVNIGIELSPFALNLVIGLGLGLAIDYSLFLVARFREELGAGFEPPEAVRRTMATAGRTVIFSSVTIAAALACLCVFPLPFLYSMGIGGLMVSLVAGAVALTFLPAAFILLGKRLGRVKPLPDGQGRWYATARTVMGRPGLFAVAAMALMLLLSAPALKTKWAGVDASILPTSKSARIVNDAVQRDFPTLSTNAQYLAIDAPKDAGDELAAYAERLRSVPDVVSVAEPRPLADGLWMIDIRGASSMISPSSLEMVDAIRATDAPFPAQLGGSGPSTSDQRAAVSDKLPLAMGLLVGSTLIILWLMTGSVLLPIKTLFMNLLTTAAATGMLVFVFQDGRFESLLGYRSQGGIEQTDFLVMVAIVFGLSTDYGVFLLTRIKEARDAHPEWSERETVAIGIQRTGGIVTAAAILLAVALGAFLMSDVVFLQELGAGAAFAVLLDAFVVRAFLVPSLMALLGKWNWWSPAPLRRLHARIGIDHGPPASPTPPGPPAPVRPVTSPQDPSASSQGSPAADPAG
ncbi:MAG: MMPL family transporter [Patulibacter sp.]